MVASRLLGVVWIAAGLGCGPGPHADTPTVLVSAQAAGGGAGQPASERQAVRWGKALIEPDLTSGCVTSSQWTQTNNDPRSSGVTESDRIVDFDAVRRARDLQVAIGTGQQVRITLHGKPRNESIVLTTEGGRYSIGAGEAGKVLRLPSGIEVGGEIASSARGLTAFLVDVPPLLPQSSPADAALDDGIAVALTTHVLAVFDYLFVGVELPKATLLGVTERDGAPVARIEFSAIVKWPKTRWMRAELVGEALLRVDNGLVMEVSAKGNSSATKLEDRGTLAGEFSVTTVCEHGASNLHGRPMAFESPP